MAKSIERTQLALMNIHYQYHPLEKFLDAAERHEILHIDLWAGYPHFLVNDATISDAASLRQQFKRRQLKPICFTPKQGGYPLNIAAAEPAIRQRTLDYLLKCVELAAELEAPMLQLLPGWSYYDESPEQGRERSCEGLRRVVERAGTLGITAILEHLPIIESNLVITAADLLGMVRMIDSPYLKAVVDTSHMGAAGETLDDYFDQLGSELVHVHFNDSDQLPLGEGNLPLGSYIRQLQRRSYQGYMTLEICSRKHYIDPDAALRTSLTTLEKLL